MRTTVMACAGLLLLSAAAQAGPIEDCNQAADADRRIRGCTQYIQQNPGNRANLAIAYTQRGDAHQRKGDPDRALADFAKAIELNPRGAGAYFSRGVTYHETKKPDQALADYDKTIALDPRHGTAYHNRGLIHAARKDYARAIADYGKAIEINPKDGATRLRRAMAHHDNKDYERAVLDYSAALPLLSGTDKGLAYLNRLIALGPLKRDGAALDDLMALAKGHPDELQRVPNARVNAIVRHLREQKREADALRVLEALVKAGYRGADPLQLGDGLKPQLIELLVRLGRSDEAAAHIADLNQYDNLLKLRVDRQYAALWSRPALLSLLQPQDFPGRELAHAQKAAARHPRSLQALTRLLGALALNGRYDEAVTLGRAALDNPGAYDRDAEHEAWLRNKIADILVAQGRHEESVEMLRPLLARDAKRENFLVSQFINLGIEFYRQGRFQEGIDTAQRAHGHSSPYGEMWIQSVSACALPRLNRGAEAEAVLLEMRKTPAVNDRAVLRALLCLGREDEAAAAVVGMLQADESRTQTLMDLQDCRENPRQPALVRELRALLVKIRERPEVRQAVDAAGLIIAEPAACGDRYGTR